MSYPNVRMRRLRHSEPLRQLVAETQLSMKDCVFPLFVHHGTNIKNPIAAMPGLFQFSVDTLLEETDELVKLGIPAVLLFGIPAKKDSAGSDSLHDQGVIQQAIAAIKDRHPQLLVIADVCLCEYTDHGHCGVMENYRGERYLHNDKTLTLLAKQSVSFVKAGADVIAPSGMIDGMVTTIRQALDQEGFENIPILSYAIKYATTLYGPFREAAEGAPKYGDRKSYQMNPANGLEALREAELDILEGADMLMVKPASYYLDVIHQVKKPFPSVPLCAYQVSGEYAMVKAAAAKGWLDEQKTAIESLLSIKRAGVDFIITYFSKDLALWLQ